MLLPTPHMRLQLFITAQIQNTKTVDGTMIAQYNQNLCPQPSDGMLKSAAKNVAGRNSIVMIEIVFIAEPSSFVAAAISRLIAANLWLVIESSCVKSAMSWLS